MIDLRGGIAAVAICLAIYAINELPRPVKAVEVVPYCVITYKAAGKHPLTGETITGWAQGYGPCYLQDQYRQI